MVVVAGAALPSDDETQRAVAPPTQPAVERAREVEAPVEPELIPKRTGDRNGDRNGDGNADRNGGEGQKKRSSRKHGGQTRSGGLGSGAAIPSSTAPTDVPPAKHPSIGDAAVVTRVVVPALGIDLPVVASDLDVPGNPPRFPLCDVAQYLTSFGQPGEGRTTYVYAHARDGMFLPLLEGSLHQDGAQMIGVLVQVYTDAPASYVYQIFEVKRHAIDLSLAKDVEPGEERLVLQTSEGPTGTVPKLQVAARLLESRASSESADDPPPRPRVCS